MKRDMDLVRAIFIAMENHDKGFAPDVIEIPDYSEEQIGYHIYLMGQAGLLDVSDASSLDGSSPQAIPHSITWNGHEFLANAREEKNWLQAKKLMKGAGEASFHIWQAVLTKIVTQSVGL
jgi:hypothetical protein